MKYKRRRGKFSKGHNVLRYVKTGENSTSVSRRRKVKSASSGYKKSILSVALVVFILIGIFGVVITGIIPYIDGRIREQGDGDGYERVDEITEADKGTGKINFVIAGVDKVAVATDTIMVGCYDFDKNEINIISIPRDTRIRIGSKFYKINSAYSLKGKNGLKKGINGTIEAVKQLTGVQEINHYVEFRLDAFRDAIDALGGVEFDVPRNMYYSDPEQDLYINLKKGKQTLDGNKAEQLIRFRSYPMGDIDRIKVQQDFIKALAEQHFNVGLVSKIPELFNVVEDNIVTDLKVTDMVRYAFNVSELKVENINMYNLPGMADDQTYGGSYWIADIDEIKELVEDKFGCDASKATDGSDGEKKSSAEVPKSSASPSPSPSPSPSNKPTATKKPAVSNTPAPSVVPEESEEPKESKSPNNFRRPSAN